MKSNNSLDELKKEPSEKEYIEWICDGVSGLKYSSETVIERIESIEVSVNKVLKGLTSLRVAVSVIILLLLAIFISLIV